MAVTYQQVIVSPIRTDQDRRTEAARHPAEFLPFTQVRSGMQVLDVRPAAAIPAAAGLGGGPTGVVFAQTQQPGPGLAKRLADHPQANLIPVERPFEDPAPAQAPKLDLVTLVLNYHDISHSGRPCAHESAAFSALKPGGHYVIIDHSGRSGTGSPKDGACIGSTKRSWSTKSARPVSFSTPKAGFCATPPIRAT